MVELSFQFSAVKIDVDMTSYCIHYKVSCYITYNMKTPNCEHMINITISRVATRRNFRRLRFKFWKFDNPHVQNILCVIT